MVVSNNGNNLIELEDYSKLNRESIKYFEIIVDDSIYSFQGTKQMWSREKITKDFFFLYYNSSKKICLDTVQGKLMILFGPGQKQYEDINWIKKDTILN